jgi:PAS domain S-box-containing protein
VADPPAEADRTRGNAGARAPGRSSASAAEALQALAREAPVGIFRADAAGDYVYINERWCRIAGIEPHAAVGRGWFSALHPDDRRRVTELWLQAVAAAAPFDLEYRLQRPDGGSSWVLGQAVPLGGGTEAGGYVGTITDITVHKRLQELLRGENRILALVASDAPLRDVMERLAWLIESQADGIIASVLFLDEAGERVTHAAGPSLPDSFVEAVEGLAIGPKAGSCGTAMYRRETVVVDDILSDPLWED